MRRFLDSLGAILHYVRLANKVECSAGEQSVNFCEGLRIVTDSASAKTPLLRVQGLCKTFKTGGILGPQGTVIASQNVSFRLQRGEAVALVGESGSGKSTVAKLLLRLETPDSGEIHLDGREMLSAEPRKASSIGSSALAGRETQSMTFLSRAVSELLYSGLAINRPW